PNLNFRGYCGTLASGIVRKGDAVVALPSGKTSRIKSIVTQDEELQVAWPPMAVTLTLEDEIDVSRGDQLVHPDNLPLSSDTVTATIVWMSDAPMLPGKQYNFKHTTQSLSGHISTIHHRIDVNTLERSPAPALELNGIGLCEVQFSQPLHFDPYRRNRTTGSFIIIDRLTNVTIGAGLIEGDSTSAPRRKESHAQVTQE